MTREKVVNLKRMKYLFLLFLKQFEVDEYKLLMQFLQLIINIYNSNHSTLFGFLTNQSEKDEDDCMISPEMYPQLNIIGQTNRRFNNQQIKRPRSLEAKSEIYEVQLDEENIRFEDNDDDTDIDYLDENYNEPLTSGSSVVAAMSGRSEFSMDMLKGRTDILDSFVMKPREVACSGNNNNSDEFVNEDEFYYENFEYDDEVEENEDQFNEQYLNQHYQNKNQSFNMNYEPDHGAHMVYSNHQQSELHAQAAASQKLIPGTSIKSRGDVTQFDSKLRVRKFSEAIRSELERKFTLNNFISGVEKTQLAKKLVLTERQVQKWFVHRREKLRRLEKKFGPITQQHTDLALDQSLDQTPQLEVNEVASQKDLSPSKTQAQADRDPAKTINTIQQNRQPGLITNLQSSSLKSHRFNRQKVIENPYKKFYLTRKPAENNPACSLKEEEASSDLQNYEENSEMEGNASNNFDYSQTSEFNNYENYNENEEDSSFADYDENLIESYEFEGCPEKPNIDIYHDWESDENNFPCLANEDRVADDSGLLTQQGSDKDVNEIGNDALETTAPSSKRKCLNVPRRLFPPHVVTHLESLFDLGKYIKENQIEEIAQVTKLNEKQIRSWFKQRRFRYNLENKEKNKDYELKQLTNLSKQVSIELEKAFHKNNYIYGNEKKSLSRQLDLKPIQLERWFYYRRKRMSSNNGQLCT